MGAHQFLNSICRIATNSNIERIPAVRRHLAWQWRKVTNAFPCELPLSQSILVARSGNCGVSALVNAHGLYDFNNMMLLKTLLRSGGVFLDVGANIGAFTLIAAEQEAAQIMAFEPHPATFDDLQRNVQLNRRGNVVLHQAAVGNADGHLHITNTPGSPTTHVTQAGEGALLVPVVRLDTLLERSAIAPKIIKIDVEGHEDAVLDGLGSLIRLPWLVMLELNQLSELRGNGKQALIRRMIDAGFSGPWFYSARTRSFSRAQQLAGEDSLFVNRARQTAIERAIAESDDASRL